MSEIKNEEEKPISSSDEDDFPSSFPETKTKSLKSPTLSNVEKDLKINQNKNSGIIEVFKDNFIQEMKHLNSLLNEYNYIGMDTEFPGIVYSLSSFTDDFYYKSLKLNVE